MPDAYLEVSNFAGGLNQTRPSDQLDLSEFPDGHNTSFRKISNGKAAIGTRPGLVTVNTTAFGSPSSVIFQKLYSYQDTSSFIKYIATVAANGELRYKKEDDTFTSALTVPANFPSPSTLCFTAGSPIVSGAVMGNRLFLVSSAAERRSLVNQTYVPWGLSPLATWAPTAAATGSASMPAETYDVAITSYNSTSGGESSTSAIQTVTLTAGQRIKIDITPTSAESAQYTHYRVYLRRQTTQAVSYRVLSLENSGGTETVTDGNVPIATTTIYVDLSSAAIAALTLVAPSTTENNGPPSDIIHVAAYGKYLLATDGRNVFWSKENAPDNYPSANFEPIETGEGDEIKAFYQYSNELCLVLCTSAIWGIFGNNPQTWVFRPINQTIGLGAVNSIIGFNDKVGWWADSRGPVIYDGESINTIGQEMLDLTTFSSSRQPYIYGGHDPAEQRIVWSVTEAGGSANNLLIPYNYQVGRFEAAFWNPFDIASLCTGFNSSDEQRLFVGNYGGQVFYFDRTSQVDGVPSGTMQGTFIASGTSHTTITDSGFYTTGSGLLNRTVVVTTETGEPVGKRTITTNSATVLTLASAITGLVSGTTYRYYVGSPDWRLYTKWLDHDQPFLRKRFDRLYFQMSSATGIQSSVVTSQLEFSESNFGDLTDFSVDGALWDDALWDSATWVATAVLKRRIALHRTGTAVRAAFFSFTPGKDLILEKIGLLSRILSDRYYA